MVDQRNLQILFASHFPIIVIETHEEQRTLDMIKSIVNSKGNGLYTWTIAQGLKSIIKGFESTRRFGSRSIQDGNATTSNPTTEPDVMLNTVLNANLKNCVVALLDFHPYLTNPNIVRLTKEIAQDFQHRQYSGVVEPCTGDSGGDQAVVRALRIIPA